MRPHALLVAVSLGAAFPSAFADEALYRYEGDVLPLNPTAGWITAAPGPCEAPCSEWLEDGHFVLRWPYAGNAVSYGYRIAEPPDAPPPTLWVEWRFRSNHPKPPHSYTCDGRFSIAYGGMHEVVYMHGDATISHSGDDGVVGLDINEFHTYRFESLDGVHYWISVDGLVFIVGAENQPNGYHTLQFSGDGGCLDDQIPDMVNEWDFVRFGTISYGERIIASDPPGRFLDPRRHADLGVAEDVTTTGFTFLDAREHADLDRFTVTFDSPNYVYIDEIMVIVTGGVAPTVAQTRRRDNDEPETVEIVLDGPLPMGETTYFIFDDGLAANVVAYTFAPGDTDGDGDADLRDAAAFQNCFGQTDPTAQCQALDLNADGVIDLADHAEFLGLLAVPRS